jgi:hypothetical protein
MTEYEPKPFQEQPKSFEGMPPSWIDETHRPSSNVFEAAAELDNSVVTGIEAPSDDIPPGLLPNTALEWPGAELTDTQVAESGIQVLGSKGHELPKATTGDWY